MRFGVVRFPGSCDEVDALLACRRFGEAELLWHKDRELDGVDAVVVPGGFSYGDYLRAGAIARFSPLMESVIEFARAGGPVLGICNGFQVLCEAGPAPGRPAPEPTRCASSAARSSSWSRTPTRPSRARASPGSCCRSRSSTPPAATTRPGSRRSRWCCATRRARTPTAPRTTSRACATPTGNVLGLMPHPEHAVDPLTGSADGGRLFESLSRVPVAG